MKRNAGYLYLLITFFCWGSIYVVSKYALAVMGPVTVSFCRYLVSVVCLYGILKWKGGHKKIAKEHWPYLLFWADSAILPRSFFSWEAPRFCQALWHP